MARLPRRAFAFVFALATCAAAGASIPPDPPPLSEREQWSLDLCWTKGKLELAAVTKSDLGEPQPTPRMMGRFALELYQGPMLIERLRFNFPLLAELEDADGGWKAPPRLQAGLTTRTSVSFPATSRGTRLELWDRASNQRWPLPWPLTEVGSADAGTRDASRD